MSIKISWIHLFWFSFCVTTSALQVLPVPSKIRCLKDIQMFLEVINCHGDELGRHMSERKITNMMFAWSNPSLPVAFRSFYAHGLLDTFKKKIFRKSLSACRSSSRDGLTRISRLLSLRSAIESQSNFDRETMQDICQDGGCLKRVLEQSDTEGTPQAGDIVQVRYALWCEGQIISTNLDSDGPFEFELVGLSNSYYCKLLTCVVTGVGVQRRDPRLGGRASHNAPRGARRPHLLADLRVRRRRCAAPHPSQRHRDVRPDIGRLGRARRAPRRACGAVYSVVGAGGARLR